MEDSNLKMENGARVQFLSSILNRPSSAIRFQPCPVCKTPMGDMPGSRDAYCSNCGYKDPLLRIEKNRR